MIILDDELRQDPRIFHLRLFLPLPTPRGSNDLDICSRTLSSHWLDVIIRHVAAAAAAAAVVNDIGDYYVIAVT